MTAPSYVYTIARVARMLRQDETLLKDIALMNMDPEDGRILDLNDDVSTTAFTAFGVENLKELLANLDTETRPSNRSLAQTDLPAVLGECLPLNSMSFIAARMIGRALAVIVIVSYQSATGWACLVANLSFMAVLALPFLVRPTELRRSARANRRRAGFIEGIRYVWSHPGLCAILLKLFLVATFGLNFPLLVSAMAIKAFHAESGD